jgi:hypothetical protein
MAQMEEVLTFPHCFFFSMMTPLHFIELDHLAPCDTILLIQDFDGMLGVGQVCLERCHVGQYHVHGFLQAPL